MAISNSAKQLYIKCFFRADDGASIVIFIKGGWPLARDDGCQCGGPVNEHSVVKEPGLEETSTISAPLGHCSRPPRARTPGASSSHIQTRTRGNIDK